MWLRYGLATDSQIFGKKHYTMCLIWWGMQQLWNNNAAAPTYESASQTRAKWCIKQSFADLKVQHEVHVYIWYMHRHRLVSGVCVCARTYVQLQKLSEYSQHVTPRFMKVMIQVASEVGPIRFLFGTSDEPICLMGYAHENVNFLSRTCHGRHLAPLWFQLWSSAQMWKQSLGGKW